MSVMWKGPSEALTATHTDPIARQLHRRASRQSIAYDTDHRGLCADVYSFKKIGDKYVATPLGQCRGGDPLNTFVSVALEYTEHDAELFELMFALILRRQEEIVEEIKYFTRQAERAVDALAEIIQAATA